MNQIELFFTELNFDFKNHFVSREFSFEKNEKLETKLKNSIFYYKSINQSSTSFYLITAELDFTEFDDLRRYIWNENQADLFFCRLSGENTILKLFYSKISPIVEINQCKIDTFDISKIEADRIENIKKWKFDNNTFWLNYQEFYDKLKTNKSIDKELIITLKYLKSNLGNGIMTQALIDRTLYIKFLEDSHIINSYFYYHYFFQPRNPQITYEQYIRDKEDENFNYKSFLQRSDRQNINILFKLIHEIFNNKLFETPEIPNEYLTKSICSDIYNAISGTNPINGQLSLFDFKFNILPIEFISYIYEIFLEKEKKRGGIYYTPKKLAQLIVDNVINEDRVGKVLDPSCGSGMFLVIAFQRLLEINPIPHNANISQIIEHKLKLLSENIFGIEKQNIAQRFTIFSLSLQVFRDIEPRDIRDYITNSLKKLGRVDLFKKYSFYNNILNENSLSIRKSLFEGLKFDYIIGNPPFFEIKQENKEECDFLNTHIVFNNKEIKVGEVAGNNQISQCFFIKIRDWGSGKSRFGFVSNSSTFYNSNSDVFREFFFKNYEVETIYELSRVKDILFESAEESVNSIIFKNIQSEKNLIKYYPVEKGLFSEKPFELLVIQEEKAFYISQQDILFNKIKLRDYLVGNEFDLNLIESIKKNSIELDNLVKKENSTKGEIHSGFKIWAEDARKKEYGISRAEWASFTREKQKKLLSTFINKYISNKKSKSHNKEYISKDKLKPFIHIDSDKFISILDNFDRPRTPDIYIGNKLIFTRLGEKLNCIYSTKELYFDFSVYTIKLQNESDYLLICAILNSDLINYFINNSLRKRVADSFPRIGIDEIKKIPIPKSLDENLVSKIIQISKNLTEKKIQYNGRVKENLNNLIFDLYGVGYIDKQRVEDFFKPNIVVSKLELEEYKETLLDSIEIFFNNKISIEYYTGLFNIIGFKIYFNKNKTPTAQKTLQFLINEIFEKKPNENFLALQEKIYGKNCVYIIKKNTSNNWTETRAFEDGQEIIRRLTSEKK